MFKERKFDQTEEKKRAVWKKRLAALFIALILLASGFGLGWLVHYFTIESELRTFLWAMDLVEENYYLPVERATVYEKADKTRGGEGLIEALEGELDIYSAYYTNEEYEAVLNAGAGRNTGIGVTVFEEKVAGVSYCRVYSIIKNSPAERAGLKRGMYLLKVGQSEENLQFLPYAQMHSYLVENQSYFLQFGYETDGRESKTQRMERKSYQATYCVYRDSQTSYHFWGVADEITMQEGFSPIAGLDDQTAYIQIDEFSGNVAEEFLSCLSKMKERGREHLILDLRSNGGGYLDVFQEMCAPMLKNATEKYPVVASAQYKSGKTTEYKTRKKACYDDYFTQNSRVYLLADEGTASASECFIGALVDYQTLPLSHIFLQTQREGRGKTYGKGIMQTHYSGLYGVMKLTSATVHWPSGNCIHGVGVTKADGAQEIVVSNVYGKEDVALNRVVSLISPQ